MPAAVTWHNRVMKKRAKPRKTSQPASSRRSDILHRAADLWQARGFGGTSVQQIADELEFSKANFFHHIESKEQLLYEICIENQGVAIERVEAILSTSASREQKLRAIVDVYVRMMLERGAIMFVWFKEKGHLTAAHQAEITRLEDKFAGMLIEFYREGIEDGSFRPVDPLVAGFFVFGMCFQLVQSARRIDRHAFGLVSSELQEIACRGVLKG